MHVRLRRAARFPELSYANPGQPRLKQWLIRSVEELSGRERYAALYDRWRKEIVPTGARVFGRMLDLIDVRLEVGGKWPPENLPDGPLVIVANHPFGIGDGVAILSLAEALGRPFRILINAELMKIPEMAAYSLPVDFSETREALRNNLAVRHEALRLLKEGVTIVVFPAGGVATAPRGIGKARDLPWKMFPARLVQEAGATVVPMHFSGQNGRLFHLVSGPMGLLESERRVARMIGSASLALRTSLLIREFARLSGGSIKVRIGEAIPPAVTGTIRDRKALLDFLYVSVFALGGEVSRRRRRWHWPAGTMERPPVAA